MKKTEILAVPRPPNAPRYNFANIVTYAKERGKDITDLTECESKMFCINGTVRFYTFQTLGAFEQALHSIY